MRVAVRGGAGYIGSVVAEVLLADGYDVPIFDNLEKGHEVAIPKTSRFGRVDIRDSEWPPRRWSGNRSATLASMRDAGVLRLVFSSTAAVYRRAGEAANRGTRPDDPD